MAEPANHIFLPWVQPGSAANMPATATDKLGTANQPGVVSLPVEVLVNAATVKKNVRLYGPGEITGIDMQQVVRTEPRHLTSDFEPNYFPAVEFDRPDFPWLFTPAKADAQGRLRPWLCLVVVRKQEGVALRPAGAAPLPSLEIQAPAKPADELPDLAESWAWAHAQLTGTERGRMKETLAGDPARSVSRLLCPRRLDADTEYIACVVPTFELGRKAGLNLPIAAAEEQRLEPAWPSGAQSPTEVKLPVYYHWAFRTGAGGDFEELVRRLEPRGLPPETGKRPVDISRPGFKVQPPPPEGAVLGLEGALRPVNAKPDAWPDASRVPFQTELKRILNTPWQIATKGGEQEPVVGPPVYGCWQAAVHEVAATTPPSPAPPAAWPPPFWLDELNLDPRGRVAAGFGTEVVQLQQEPLMASAWEQLGEIEKINQRLRQAQLGRAVNTFYLDKTFKRLPEESFMKIVAPAQSRLLIEERPAGLLPPGTPPVRTLLAQKLAGSVVPSNTISAPLRRITRPRGAVNRQYTKAGAQGVGSMLLMFNKAVEPVAFKKTEVQPGETVWVDDATPAGAVLAGDGEGWAWVNANPSPYTGARCHQSALNAGVHQHYFHGAADTLDIGEGEKLFVYLFIDPNNVPNEVMLQWHTAETGWEHRAYWGANNIGWGVDGTNSRRNMGDFPRIISRDNRTNPPTLSSSWVRLEVEARAVGLEGRTIDGMAFTLHGGRATWDRAGKVGSPLKGVVTTDRVSDMLPAAAGFHWVVDHWERVPATFIQMHDTFRLGSLAPASLAQKTPATPESGALRAAAVAHHEFLNRTFNTGAAGTFTALFRDTRTKLATQEIKLAALVSLNPDQTVSARATAGLVVDSPQPDTGDPLEPVMDAPTFPQPMYEALRDLSPAALFPGLEHVPPDSIQLLETNANFVESFMVGLNAEMSRELLWRGYPTDQRGTYFQHFWDALGNEDVSDAQPAPPPDIPPIHRWGRRRLGTNATGVAAGNKLVLLIRGELLRRYPNTVIYAVRAVRNGERLDLPLTPAAEIHPVFRGTLDPDVTFLGFDLTAADATAEPGLFFVLQQQPTEPRFGMDAAPFADRSPKTEGVPELKSWDDLNWGHLAPDETRLRALAHVKVNRPPLVPKQNGKGQWGRNSAHMAYITKQLPARVAIHASQLLPTEKPKTS